MNQKTVIIWDNGEDPIEFFVADGDLRRLNGHYLNSYWPDNLATEAKMRDAELDQLIMDEGKIRSMEEDFPTTAVLEGAFVIVCGMLP